IAQRCGLSRFAVSRFLRGRAEPRLPEFLALVEAASGRVVDLASVLADPKRLPTALPATSTIRARLQLAMSDPCAHAGPAVVCLHSYGALPTHDDAWIARELGIDAESVRRSLAVLEGAGQVRWDGRHWEATPLFRQDYVGDPETSRRLKDHW